MTNRVPLWKDLAVGEVPPSIKTKQKTVLYKADNVKSYSMPFIRYMLDKPVINEEFVDMLQNVTIDIDGKHIHGKPKKIVAPVSETVIYCFGNEFLGAKAYTSNELGEFESVVTDNGELYAIVMFVSSYNHEYYPNIIYVKAIDNDNQDFVSNTTLKEDIINKAKIAFDGITYNFKDEQSSGYVETSFLIGEQEAERLYGRHSIVIDGNRLDNIDIPQDEESDLEIDGVGIIFNRGDALDICIYNGYSHSIEIFDELPDEEDNGYGYEEDRFSISWDMNPEGHIIVENNTGTDAQYYIKISDKLLSGSELVGAKVSTIEYDVPYSFIVDPRRILEEFEGLLIVGEGEIIIVKEDNTVLSFGDAEIVFPEKGLYVAYWTEDDRLYTISGISKTIVHTISEKYLPKTENRLQIYFWEQEEEETGKILCEITDGVTFEDIMDALDKGYIVDAVDGSSLKRFQLNGVVSGDFFDTIVFSHVGINFELNLPKSLDLENFTIDEENNCYLFYGNKELFSSSSPK